jgi:NAD(P)-dependent dehydrogenase (short-subunit alcohol dehydrogenase family)
MVDATIARHGRIDILVNNAGVNFVKPFDEMTVADWDRVIGVDLRGTFLCTHAVVKHFLAQGSGNVIGISSVHSRAGLPGAAPYDAAKWGMVGMTKSLAVEFASRGLRFNCVSPGLMDTAIWQDLLKSSADPEACKRHWFANIPMGRTGAPQEIGTVCAFLASDAASYVTGANYEVDGGMLAQLATPPDYDTANIDG